MTRPEPCKPALRARVPAVARIALAFLAFAAAAAPAQAAEGLQLVPTNWLLFLVLLLGFIALIKPLDALLFRPLFKVLEEREERIDGARRRAEQLEAEADEVLARYRSAVAEVRDESERGRRDQVDTARTEQASITGDARSVAESEIEARRAQLSAAVDDARAGLRASTEALARDAAERILGRSLA